MEHPGRNGVRLGSLPKDARWAFHTSPQSKKGIRGVVLIPDTGTGQVGVQILRDGLPTREYLTGHRSAAVFWSAEVMVTPLTQIP